MDEIIPGLYFVLIHACMLLSGFSGKMCEKLMSVSFLDTDSYIQWPKLDFQSSVNITIVMKTESDSGLIFYTGQEQHLAVELFRGRVGISFYVGNTATSTMFSYIFSYVEVNDDRIHNIELLLNRRNFTMRVDGGVSRSVLNQGNRDFLDINDDVYFGGLPPEVSTRAQRKFHIRSQSSFRGELILAHLQGVHSAMKRLNVYKSEHVCVVVTTRQSMDFNETLYKCVIFNEFSFHIGFIKQI